MEARQMAVRLKDPVSGLTHLAAMGFVLACVPALALSARSPRQLLAYVVFGFSLVLLYAASSAYHLSPRFSERGSLLHRLDHVMIYVLIAGTYTPVCLITLRDSWGLGLLAAIWGLALLGAALKLVLRRVNHWFSTVSYVAMGWLVVLAAPELLTRLPIQGIAWFAAGGLSYSLGALVYAVNRPRLWPPAFGSHELFHLFVIAGSVSHLWATFRYVH